MVKIRPAKIRDAAGLAELNLAMMKYHRRYGKIFEVKENAKEISEKWFKKSIRSPKSKILVAEDKGRLVGYIWAHIRKRPAIYEVTEWGDVSDVFVAANYRRQGIGKKFLELVFEWFRKRGISYVDLFVVSGNEIAQALWRKYKFKEYFKKMYRRV